MCEKYQGWTNRETWALVLHLDNDQGLYEGVLDVVRDRICAGDAEHATDECPDPSEHRYGVVQAVKEYAEQLLTVDGYIESTGYDSLPAALSRIAEDIGSLYRVDWDEVGEHYLQTVSEASES